MMHYSVAIRTLGLNPGLLRRELESIFAQTVPPREVVIYIARGYAEPAFRVASERYVVCDKGMVAQRAVGYSEISSPLLLLLDDDVILSPDTAQRMASALEEGGYDCISADVFANHLMSFPAKVYSALSNLTFPHFSHRWAFKMHANGSFSYINRPRHTVYRSQTGAGPCCLWRKDVLLWLRFCDELWLDGLGFAYNDDGLESYKLHSNGGLLGVHFDAGAVHEGGKTASAAFHRRADSFRTRAKAVYLVWHRSLYGPARGWPRRAFLGASFWLKALLMVPVHLVAAVRFGHPSIPWHYVQGLAQGVRQARSDSYRSLPSYIIDRPKPIASKTLYGSMD